MTYAYWRRHFLMQLKRLRLLGMPKDELRGLQMWLEKLRHHHGPRPF